MEPGIKNRTAGQAPDERNLFYRNKNRSNTAGRSEQQSVFNDDALAGLKSPINHLTPGLAGVIGIALSGLSYLYLGFKLLKVG
ncbi:hypothetical protein CHA01nite_39250 [Chryseobacterium hagamense]|uniref:Uncharacterized protein n=1 Tax=Chryseobacterium hagamense TaxID=395935 RepID=A0A511YSL9_9FLAO|nr:hypothetical protein CHA01nite_39250 [Chryseobacterium hagamense]